MHKINLLPKWVLPGTRPSVYDTESGSALEMVAKVYGAMRTLQETYNEFADEVNKTILEFMDSTTKDQECFKANLTEIMHNYIRKIDEKIKMQDLVINKHNEAMVDAINYMKENIVETTTRIIESGEVDDYLYQVLENVTNIRLEYNSETEELTLVNPVRPCVEYNEETENLTIINLVREEIEEEEI